MDQFKVIGSVRMSMKHTKRKKEMGKRIDPGRARLGTKIDQLVVYTSLMTSTINRGNSNNCKTMLNHLTHLHITMPLFFLIRQSFHLIYTFMVPMMFIDYVFLSWLLLHPPTPFLPLNFVIFWHLCSLGFISLIR